MNRRAPVSYSFRHHAKARQRVSEQSESSKRPSRGFGATPGGWAFVWLLTLTSVAVVLAVYFSFRGANEAPRESPAPNTGAAIAVPSPPSGGFPGDP